MYSFLNLRNIYKLKILRNSLVQTNYQCYNQFFSKSSRMILNRPVAINYVKNNKFKINNNIVFRRFKTDLPSNNAPRVKLSWAEMKRLLSLAKNEKWTIIGAIGCLAISSGITMAVPYAFGKIMDSIYLDAKELHHAKTKFKQFCLFLCGVFIIGGLANFGRVYLFHNASLRIVKDLRSKLFNRMIRQEAAWHDTKGTGELVNRLSNDTYFVGDSLSQNLSNGLRSMVMATVGASMMFYTSPELAFVGLGIVPCIAGLAIVYGRYVKKISRQMMDRYAEVMKHGEERLANVKSVKMFTKEAYENETFGEKLNAALGIAYKDSLAKATFFGLTGFSGNVVIITVLFYGGNLVADNHLTVGALTSFIIYAGYTALSLGGISNFYTEMYRGIGSATRIFEIFDRQYAIPIDGGLIPKTVPKGQIKFENVVFSYPSREKSQILNNFNFSAHPGTITAIVGRSGSGKTTIAQLLLRLYDPQQGAIYLDGINLRDLNPYFLRSYIGAVPQEPILFSGSIRENIMYGLNIGETITETAFDEICRQAHVTEFISTFPNGMETMVGQRGVLLSGGQKQRVAIARAILKNPTILILDEATSALDAMSESLVQDALENLTKNRTVLTIAHRLSTIRNADKIIVIGDGIVKEEGSYDELIEKNEGYFRDLVKLQTFVKSQQGT